MTMNKHLLQCGFTLIEVMVVLAIMGIVMSYGIPGMQSLMANQRMKSASFELVTTAMFARSEAVKRGIPVYVAAPSANLTNGWCVQVVSSTVCNPASPDANATMRVQKPAAGVTYSFITGGAPITFNRAGRLATQVRVQIVDNDLSALLRCVTIDVGGNARSTVGACS